MEIQETSTGAESLNNETTEDTEANQATIAAKDETAGGIAGHIAKVQSKGGALDAQTDAAPYTPNFKFKAADKEQEFDDFVRGAIKSPEQEKKLRELYEKAYGLDHVKAERERFRTDYRNVNDQYSSLNKGLDHLSTMLKNKDYHGFFKALELPEQDVLQYALSRVQYKEMPPEQRQALDSQYEAQQKLAYLEQANQELVTGYQSQMVQQRTSELDGYIGRPEVAQVASDFDARVGKPGAFRDEVIRRGQYYASLPESQDITVEQAVREIMGLVGFNNTQAQNGAQASEQNMEESTPAPTMQNQKPVIPNIKGRGTSPVKKVARSIEDLRNMSKNFQG